MRKILSLSLSLALVASFAAAAMAKGGPTIVAAGKEQWVAGTGPNKGLQVAALLGNPEGSGFYVVRIKFPAGFKFPAHYHKNTENVTVISGTLWVGLGDKLDMKKAMPLTAGSFASVPSGVHHFGFTKSPTVIQIEGEAPESLIVLK